MSHVTPALQHPQPAPPCEDQRPELSGRRTTPTPPVVLLETQALSKSCEKDTYLFDIKFWLQLQLQAQHNGLPITNGAGHSGPGGEQAVPWWGVPTLLHLPGTVGTGQGLFRSKGLESRSLPADKPGSIGGGAGGNDPARWALPGWGVAWMGYQGGCWPQVALVRAC